MTKFAVGFASFAVMGLIGCSGEEAERDGAEDEARAIGTSQSAILGGSLDYGHNYVGKKAGCSGVLIGTHTVLTSGHCISGGVVTYYPGHPGAPYVDVDGYYSTVPRTRYEVSQTIQHPYYDYDSAAFDLGVMILLGDVWDVTPVQLSDGIPYDNQPFIGVGFGKTSKTQATSDGQRRSMNTSVRAGTIGPLIFKSGYAGGPQACEVDSGGAAVIRVGATDVLLGLHSRGDCSTSSTWTRIDPMREWIADKFVTGGIREKWVAPGMKDALGLARTDEQPTQCRPGGRYNNFDRGAITWSPRAWAHPTWGAIRQKWASMGFECSYLGLPISDEEPYSTGARQFFEGGVVEWTPSGGAQARQCNNIYDGQALVPGNRFYSCNGGFFLSFQNDGNLVLYKAATGAALWASNTVGNGSTSAVMQSDGNFVMYGGQRIVSTKTAYSPGGFLSVQDDGNLVIYDQARRPVWTKANGPLTSY